MYVHTLSFFLSPFSTLLCLVDVCWRFFDHQLNSDIFLPRVQVRSRPFLTSRQANTHAKLLNTNMRFFIAPDLTQADDLVLRNLIRDVDVKSIPEGNPHSLLGDNEDGHDDETTEQGLLKLNKEPTVFTAWDLKDLQADLRKSLIGPYVRWAQGIVRNPTDVVFLTHILLYLSTSLTSAIFLYYRFSWPHGVLHSAMQLWYCGSFTLMLHNHIHNNGILAKQYAWLDSLWPYVLEVLMGHTWHSYYYHHVKHHHVENNGPEDLSSTVRYQRDELLDFLIYVGRFIFFIWIELPLYFFRKNRAIYGAKVAFWELSNYLFIILMAKYNFRATLFVLIIPLIQMRLGLMIGNWGQHALIDKVEPMSDLRSSITLIDVPVRNKIFLASLPPLTCLCSPTIVSIAELMLEQSLLLQRRLPHFSPSKPASALARPSSSVLEGQIRVRCRLGPGLPQHRLFDDDDHVAEKGLFEIGALSSTNGGSGGDE